jgi:hypothetical protein
MLFGEGAAQAQAQGTVVVSTCGTANYGPAIGQTRATTQDVNGNICGSNAGGGGGTAPVPLTVTPTDRGGTMASGGTSQTAMAANASRKGCWIQNPINAGEDLYISSTASAVIPAGTPDDADLSPGGAWSCLQGSNIIQTAIRVNAATSGHAFLAKETQ